MPAHDATERLDTAVIILAAGSGRRLGLGPKALVPLGDGTFLSRIVGVCHEAGLHAVTVVGRADDLGIGMACDRLGVALLRNADPDRGMSSSVHLGLAEGTQARRRAVMVFPVDVPLVGAGTAETLARAAITDARAWVRPCFEGRGGHPIVLGADVVKRVLDGGDGVPLRDALRGVPVVDVACDDAAILADVDSPVDLVAVRAAFEALSTKR